MQIPTAISALINVQTVSVLLFFLTQVWEQLSADCDVIENAEYSSGQADGAAAEDRGQHWENKGAFIIIIILPREAYFSHMYVKVDHCVHWFLCRCPRHHQIWCGTVENMPRTTRCSWASLLQKTLSRTRSLALFCRRTPEHLLLFSFWFLCGGKKSW